MRCAVRQPEGNTDLLCRRLFAEVARARAPRASDRPSGSIERGLTQQGVGVFVG